MRSAKFVLQEEIASSRRSSANSEIAPGQAWPKKSAPLPTKESVVPRYEPYQPQQSRQEWAANSPQNMNNCEARSGAFSWGIALQGRLFAAARGTKRLLEDRALCFSPSNGHLGDLNGLECVESSRMVSNVSDTTLNSWVRCLV
jgi:hypothetical protein